MGTGSMIDADRIPLYYIALEKQFDEAKADMSDEDRHKSTAVNQLECIFGKGRAKTWEDAYLAEQLLVSIHPEPTLDAEIKRREAQAKGMRPKGVVAEYQNNPPTGIPEKRAYLCALIEELQWAYGSRALRRAHLRKATITGSQYFGGAFLFFLLILVLGDHTAMTDKIGDFLLPYALAAGFLGASYSTLTSLKAPHSDMPLEQYMTLCSGPYILSRVLIGLCASLVVFFFLQSEMVVGTTLPKISDIVTNAEAADEVWTNQLAEIKELTRRNAGDKALIESVQTILEREHTDQILWLKVHSLVIILCFLAGFSEKLVPNLLANMEQSISAKGTG